VRLIAIALHLAALLQGGIFLDEQLVERLDHERAS
jgi:hypothetical protein